MSQSRAERIKEIIFYAPVGLIGIIRDNASTVIDVLIGQGKSTAQNLEPTTKEVPETEPSVEEAAGTKSKLKKSAQRGIDDLMSDFRKNRNIIDGAVGSFSILRDNFSSFGKVAQNRGKKEINTVKSEVQDAIFSQSKDPEQTSVQNADRTLVSKLQNSSVQVVTKSYDIAKGISCIGFKISRDISQGVTQAFSRNGDEPASPK